MSLTSQRSALSRCQRGLAVTALALAALLSVSAVSATGASAATSKNVLNFTEQQQSQTNWCWAATGVSIANWFGKSVSQNSFCDAAFGYSQNSSCPNNAATLANDQAAYRWLGISPGNYISNTLSYSGVQSEINANRPVQARIGWSSGGGHMEVLYGYDTSKSWVYWGDPWPSDNRYNWATYSYYASNSSFTWTHTLYGIGA